MSARIEQIKWAVQLQMRELPPGSICTFDEDPLRWGEIDINLAVGGFSRDLLRGSYEQRLVAVEALGWLLDRRAISPLVRGLRDPCIQVRRAAAHSLKRYELPEWAIDAVIQRFDDRDPGVRTAAAESLGCARSGSVVPELVSVLSDPVACVRAAAARSLCELGCAGLCDKVAIAPLQPLLDDREPLVAYAAYWALAAQGGSEVDGMRAEWRYSERGRQVWALVVQ